MDPLHLEALDNHDNQPATVATKGGGGWQEGVNQVTTQPRVRIKFFVNVNYM
jgi:hypothetical protein